MALVDAGINFEVVPGVTAGIAAAAVFGIPLTHREKATSTLFITGHQCSETDSHDWKNLARLDSTLVFYMSMTRIVKIVSALIKYGKAVDTPIAIVKNATMGNQEIFTSSLKNIHTDIEKICNYTPSIIIIGEVVNHYAKLRECLDYFPSQRVEPIGDLGFEIWENQTVTA
jgi:uroporphyrinogen III methyltransferase/synthase